MIKMIKVINLIILVFSTDLAWPFINAVVVIDALLRRFGLASANFPIKAAAKSMFSEGYNGFTIRRETKSD